MVAYLPLSRTVFIAIAQQSLNAGFKAKLTGLIFIQHIIYKLSRSVKGQDVIKIYFSIMLGALLFRASIHSVLLISLKLSSICQRSQYSPLINFPG
ncbi:MAG: hypothetical protein ACJAZI_001000 [Cycloclasticus sp.]|jgi:hypothetical protein